MHSTLSTAGAIAADLYSRCRALRLATTPAQRDAVYRFRYAIYARERNRRAYPGVDHTRERIATEEDEAPGTLHFYFASAGRVTASVRVRHWAPGELPPAIRSHYAIDALPGLDRLHLCDTTQLMVERSQRGALTSLALTSRAGEYAIRRCGVQAAVATCAPGLVAPYQRLGFRPIDAPPAPADVLLLPLVCLVGDLAHARRVHSLWLPVLSRVVAEGVVPEVSGAALSTALDRVRRVVTDPEALRALLAASPQFRGLAPDAVSWLLEGALSLEVPAGTRVTRAGVREHEMYLPLTGTWARGGPRPRLLEPGDLFGAGEEDRAGPRPAGVRAVSGGALLVLRHSRLDPTRARGRASKAAQVALLQAVASCR